MRAFISWSGGKDCTFALRTFLETEGNHAAYLVNFAEPNTNKSRSHGVSRDLILAQSQALTIPLLWQALDGGYSYRYHLENVIEHLKLEGITAGVFGDIYLVEHRKWIEEVCAGAGITALFPLWGQSTDVILDNFLNCGFRAQIVSVKERFKSILGKELNHSIVDTLSQIDGVDPCGENGEYHTYVFDGPIFAHPVQIKANTEPYTSNNQIFQCYELY